MLLVWQLEFPFYSALRTYFCLKSSNHHYHPLVEQFFKLAGDGSAGFAVQVGVVGCIWAGVYEIGRLETGDALNSREVDEALAVIAREFGGFIFRFASSNYECLKVEKYYIYFYFSII